MSPSRIPRSTARTHACRVTPERRSLFPLFTPERHTAERVGKRRNSSTTRTRVTSNASRNSPSRAARGSRNPRSSRRRSTIPTKTRAGARPLPDRCVSPIRKERALEGRAPHQKVRLVLEGRASPLRALRAVEELDRNAITRVEPDRRGIDDLEPDLADPLLSQCARTAREELLESRRLDGTAVHPPSDEEVPRLHPQRTLCSYRELGSLEGDLQVVARSVGARQWQALRGRDARNALDRVETGDRVHVRPARQAQTIQIGVSLRERVEGSPPLVSAVEYPDVRPGQDFLLVQEPDLHVAGSVESQALDEHDWGVRAPCARAAEPGRPPPAARRDVGLNRRDPHRPERIRTRELGDIIRVDPLHEAVGEERTTGFDHRALEPQTNPAVADPYRWRGSQLGDGADD